MSLDSLHSEINGLRRQAAELCDDWSRTEAAVKADANLTVQGKSERLVPTHQQLSDKVGALHQQERAVVTRTKESLERRVFGIPPAAAGDTAKLVAFRDAQSRAAQVADRDDAEQVYRSAIRSDDRVLAAAILGRALSEGWRGIIDDHGSRNPADRTALDDLEQIGKFQRNSLLNTTNYMVPTLNVQFSAGFPRLPQTSRGPVRTVPSLGDVMAERLRLS